MVLDSENFDLTRPFEYWGKFWRPGCDQRQVVGQVRYKPNEFVTLGLPERLCVGDPFSEGPPFCLHGSLIDGTPLTLVQAFVKGSNRETRANDATEIAARRAIFGGHFDLASQKWNQLSLRFTGLESWLGHRFFEHLPLRNGGPSETLLKFTMPQVLSFEIPSERLRIGLGGGLRSRNSAYSAEYESWAQFGLIFEEGHTLDEWEGVAQQLQNLLVLLMGQPVVPREISLRTSGVTKYAENFLVAVYRAEAMDDFLWPDALIGYPRVGQTAELIFQRWFQSAKKLKIARDAFFFSLYTPHDAREWHFLNMAQCLEFYHRATSDDSYMQRENYLLVAEKMTKCIPSEMTTDHRASLKSRISYGYQYSLRKRIERVIEGLPGEIKNYILGDECNFAARVAKTRNYFTHYDDSDKDDSYSGASLHYAAERLGVLLRVVFLRDLGVGDSIIADILKKNPRIHSILSIPLSSK